MRVVRIFMKLADMRLRFGRGAATVRERGDLEHADPAVEGQGDDLPHAHRGRSLGHPPPVKPDGGPILDMSIRIDPRNPPFWLRDGGAPEHPGRWTPGRGSRRMPVEPVART